MNYRNACIIVIFLELIIAGIVLNWNGFTLSALQVITRFSGRLSLLIFSIIFIFRYKPLNIDVFLLGNPYHVFALTHGIHLGELLSYSYLSHTSLASVRLFGGVIAYTLVFIMPFAAYFNKKGKLSTIKFQIIEKIFLYYLWIIFFLFYLPKVRGTLPYNGGNYWEYVFLLGWLSIIMGMKLVGLIKPKPKTSR